MLERKTKGDLMQDYILAQAEKVFMKNGYHGTSMEMIAESAQISKPTLYRYFSGKYELFMRLNIRVTEEIMESISSLMENSTDRFKTFDEIIDYLYTIGAAKGDFFRMMTREHHLISHPHFDEHLNWYINILQDSQNLLIRFVSDWVKPELKEQVGLDEIAVIIYNILSGILFEIIMGNPVDPQQWKLVIRYIFNRGLMKEE